MRNSLFVIALLPLFLLSQPAWSQIIIEIDGDTETLDVANPSNGSLPFDGSDFLSYLNNNGFSYGLADADIAVSGAGTFTFELLGGRTRSGMTRSFFANGEQIAAVNSFDVFIDSNGVNGLPLSQSVYIPEAGQIDNNAFYFNSTSGATSGQQLDFFTQNFATFVPDSNTLSGLSTVLFALEDSNNNFDYDDMLIRATFTLDSANVPAPAGPGLLLLGLAYIWRQQRKNQL